MSMVVHLEVAINGKLFEFDYHRSERTGINEVIFALDKSTNEINHILKTINNNSLLITKLEKSKYESLELKHLIDYDQTSLTGFFNFKKKELIQNEISIVAAGTSDLNIATEAKRTLEFFGYKLRKFMMLVLLVFGES